ncbi:MAG: hypothetical protein ACO2ZP_06875 [Bacteriovoracaceae bacterium]
MYGNSDSLDADYENQSFFINEVPSDNVEISERNQNTGLVIKDFDTGKDNHRYGIQVLTTANILDASKLMGFEFTYGNKMDIGGWAEFLISKITAEFSQLAQTHSGLASSSDELDQTSEDLLQVGLGLGYRSTIIQNFIDSRYFFETTTVYATYNTLDENFTGQSYKGAGLRVEYGLHRRLSIGQHMGLKLSYNLSSVKRPALREGESGEDRSLVLRWIGVSVDFALYF